MNRQFSVLVVDDNAALRLGLRLMLDGSRFQVVDEAEDGQLGVSAAERLQPDIVILDLDMPALDGRDALPRIRRCSPDSRVLIYTAGAGDPEVAAQADGYLDKSEPPAVLMGALESLIARA